jgi:hypothetical protein
MSEECAQKLGISGEPSQALQCTRSTADRVGAPLEVGTQRCANALPARRKCRAALAPWPCAL